MSICYRFECEDTAPSKEKLMHCFLERCAEVEDRGPEVVVSLDGGRLTFAVHEDGRVYGWTACAVSANDYDPMLDIVQEELGPYLCETDEGYLPPED